VKLLLDTHILLWCAADTLPERAAAYILNPQNVLYFSPASIWEIVIKRGLGRRDFNADPFRLYTGLLENGYGEITITTRHTLAVGTLPPLHKDPFDRILLAQALSEGVSLLTCDPLLAVYSAPVIYVK
jgi:PIN domain nuclease of toxin-antitoxin system